jgi:hypothetical protein
MKWRVWLAAKCAFAVSGSCGLAAGPWARSGTWREENPSEHHPGMPWLTSPGCGRDPHNLQYQEMAPDLGYPLVPLDNGYNRRRCNILGSAVHAHGGDIPYSHDTFGTQVLWGGPVTVSPVGFWRFCLFRHNCNIHSFRSPDLFRSYRSTHSQTSTILSILEYLQ